jgi:YVTN family beta-propeller protein
MKTKISLLIAAAAALTAQQAGLFSILKSNVSIGRQPGDLYLTPTNQLLHPWGALTPIAGRPVDITFDSQKRILAVLNLRGVAILDGSSGAQLAEIKSKPTSYTGNTFRPGDRELWTSETARNGPDSIYVTQFSDNGTPGKSSRIDFKGHPVPAGIAFSKDGAKAFVAFSRNNTLAVIDAASQQIEREIETGMAPHGVVVSAKNNRIFVSNRAGRRPKASDTLAPSSGSNIASDAKTGSSASGTLSVIDGKDFTVREIEVGLAPSAIVLSPDETQLAVANGHSDTVSIVDTKSLKRKDVKIPAYPDSTLGSQPIGVAFSPDGKRIYVACGGTNAIVVIEDGKIVGAVPTGWFPSGIAVGKDGALNVANIKGLGNTAGKNGTFNSRQFEGLIERIPAPQAPQLSAGMREVRASNAPQLEPSGGVKNLPSLGIEHVFFIIKENRTYDQVFGDMGRGESDPKLCMYGRDVSPNHHALADKYVLIDNFHTGGAISFDGHHWLMQSFVSDYVERAFGSSPRGYAWNMNDALTIAPTGFFWQSATKPLNVRIFGEFCIPGKYDAATQNVVDMNEGDVSKWSEYLAALKKGTWQSMVGCRSGVPALAPIMSKKYSYNSTAIPDQLRAEAFLEELAEREKSGVMPHINIMTLNSDHTNGTRPGSPTPKAMVADNDLALGRIVEALSKSRFWSKSLILVTEDDAQDGLDHIDGHRTIALAIGPNVRRAAIDKNFYNHTSMVKTIQEIFHIPAKTRYLASARAMTSVFTPEKDLSGYKALQPKIGLEEMNPPLKALKGRQLWAAQQSAAMNWNDIDDIPQDTLNRILWWDSKGYDIPYPSLARK